MNLEFILASSNTHKALEFSELFSGLIRIVPAESTLDVVEDGQTFTENAYKKAWAYFEHFNKPVMADDSGLTLEGLPDLLGVQSARFAPHLNSYVEKNALLLEILEKEKLSSRRAYFCCVLCFILSPKEIYFFEGRLHGQISTEPKGLDGFGYDPIFIPERSENDGLTLAQLKEWKNSFSHRAKASQMALDFFKESVDKVNK